MPSIGSHHSKTTTKAILIGDSGTGKTGSLASLAAAGFKLRIIDLDNGLDVLRSYLTHPDSLYVKKNPKCAENVHYVTCTDTMKIVNGLLIPKKAVAWQKAVGLLSHWQEKDEEGKVVVDFGPVTSWGPDTVLVIDSLSMLSTVALHFHLQLNGWLGQLRTQNEARRDIGATQAKLREFLELLYDGEVKCNVILTAHITMVTETGLNPQTLGEDGKQEQYSGYPAAIGRALSPHIPRYFNTVLHCKVQGQGPNAKHKIYTKSQGIVLAKNTNPLAVKPEYSLETGLAEYFEAVR